MHGLIGRMIATPGQRDALGAILLEGVSGMPGCMSYVVANDPADENALWITEVWDSTESHKASLKLPSVQAAIAKGRPLIAGFDNGTTTTPLGGHGLARVSPVRADGAPRIDAAYPYLCARDAARAIEFYERVFGAVPGLRLDMPDGRVGHAEFTVGPTEFMISDEFLEMNIRSPESVGGTGMRIHLHVDDVDALTKRAVEAGATVIMEPADQAHGERQARIRDPFGHEWLLGHELEKVSADEMQRRLDKLGV